MNIEQLGWNDSFSKSFGSLSDAKNCIPARVAREDRTGYVIYAREGAWRASISGALRFAANRREQLPAVGDWVAVTPRRGEDAAVIHAVLPRNSAIRRTAAGETGEVQLVAANVDVLLICCGLDGDFNLRRIERYMTLAYAGGVTPVVVLSKADLREDAESHRAAVEAVAPGCDVLLVSALTGQGLDAIRRAIPVCGTVALVGSSGVGKSTITNCLLGEQRMATHAVREHDSRGRHTTTYRQLMVLPDGGVIIDTPGMRELQLSADDDALRSSFADIEELAGKCRFRDCRHEREPGCAVLHAVDCGDLDSSRFESWNKQRREVAYFERRDDKRAMAEEKARWKTIHKAAQRHYQEKYRM